MTINDELEEICYKQNFLDRVILRIDFLYKLSEKEFCSENIFKTIMKSFPVIEKDEVIHENTIQVKQGEFCNGESSSLIKKNFTDNERSKKLKFSKQYLIIEIFKYDQFKDVLSYFSEIIESFEKKSIRRIGIRYINIFDLSKITNFNFNRYFNKSLLSFSFLSDLDDIISPTRALNVQEYTYDDNKLRFQYGLFNPDFPAELKKKSFVLDYDCFFQGLIEDNSEIISKIIKLHFIIQYMFEKSISGKLKEILNKDE